MRMFFNQAIVWGNMGSDPKLKALPNGTSVTDFSVATNKKYKNDKGELVEQTEWHNIVVFGKQAENICKYLAKGSNVMIVGELRTRDWEKDGIRHYRTEIVAKQVIFGTKANKPETPEEEPSVDDIPDEKPAEAQGSAGSTQQVEYPETDINPDTDIPF